jgi:hypothetical protein
MTTTIHLQQCLRVLSGHFSIDQKSNERIDKITAIVQQIDDPDLVKCLSNMKISLVELEENQIDQRAFLAAQKCLLRQEIDRIIRGDRNDLITCLRSTSGTVFFQILLEEAKSAFSFCELIKDLPQFSKHESLNYGVGASLCFCWAESRNDLQRLAEELTRICPSAEHRINRKRGEAFELLAFSKNSSKSMWLHRVSVFNLTGPEKIALANGLITNNGFAAFPLIRSFSFDVQDTDLFLEFAKKASSVKQGGKLYLKEFWMTLPFTLSQKKELFNLFYASRQSLSELFNALDYFGWDRDSDQAELFQLVKASLHPRDIPDFRVFSFSAKLRAELAYAYCVHPSIGAFFDTEFFDKLPLEDVESNQLYPILQRLTPYKIVSHLSRFSLEKGQVIELLKFSAPFDPNTAEYLDAVGLDPVHDREAAKKILSFLNTVDKTESLGRVCTFFQLTAHERFCLLTQLAARRGYAILLEAYRLGILEPIYRKEISQIVMCGFLGAASASIYLDLAHLKFPKEELFTILLQSVKFFSISSVFDNFNLLGIDPLLDVDHIVRLIEEGIQNKECLLKAGWLPVSKEVKLKWALTYAKSNMASPTEFRNLLLKEWGIDIYQEQEFLFAFLMHVSRSRKEVLSNLNEYPLAIEQKRQIFLGCLHSSTETLAYLNACKGDFIPDHQTLISWMKLGAGDVSTIAFLLRKYSFTLDEKHRILHVCSIAAPQKTAEHFHEFEFSYRQESKFALTLILIVAMQHFPKLSNLPFTIEQKIYLLEQVSGSNFPNCISALNELKLDPQAYRNAFIRVASKSVPKDVELASTRPLDCLLPVLESGRLSAADCRLLAKIFFSVNPQFIFRNMAIFHLDAQQDRSLIADWVKNSKQINIESFSDLINESFLTKEEQISLFLKIINHNYSRYIKEDKFLEILTRSAVDPIFDRELFLHILFKKLQFSPDLPAFLKRANLLEKNEWTQLFEIHSKTLGINIFLNVDAYDLHWETDRKLLLELLYSSARLGYLKDNLITQLHKLPLSLAEKQKTVLLALSSNPTFPIIESLHLLEWDPVRDKKTLWRCWQFAAQLEPTSVIRFIHLFPYEKKERIALAKICIRHTNSELIYKPQSFLLDPIEDRQSLFELACCLTQQPYDTYPHNEIPEKLGLSLDPKETAILECLFILTTSTILSEEGAPTSAPAFTELLNTLQNKLPDYAGEVWKHIVKKLVIKSNAFFPKFELLFSEHLLPFFSGTRITVVDFVSEVQRCLQCAIDTPNQMIKSHILSLLFHPLIEALGRKDLSAVTTLADRFNLLIKRGQTATLPFRLYLYRLFGEENEIVKLAERFDKVYNTLSKKEKNNLLQASLSFFQALLNQRNLKQKEKRRLFQQIFCSKMLAAIAKASKQTVKEYAKPLETRFQLAKIVLSSSTFNDYLQIKNSESLETYFLNDIPKKMSLLVPGLFPHEVSIIQKFWAEPGSRTFESFFNYCGSLQSLSSEKDTLMALWKEFLIATAEGNNTYRNWRYQKTPYCPHWEKLSSFPEILKQWQSPLPPSEKSIRNFSTIWLNYQEIFFQKIVQDSHLSQVEHLSAYLQNAAISGVKEMDSASAKFQAKAIEFLEKYTSKQITTNSECRPWLETLKNLLESFSPNAEFLHDLNGMIRFTQRFSKEKILQAYVTDDPVHLHLSGTEIEGSCMRTNGDPSKNKCLLGYMANPYIQIVALVNETGRLEARAMLKLLMTEKSSDQGVQWQPVLFLERATPPFGISDKEVELLWETAKDLADRLGIPLAAKELNYQQCNGGKYSKGLTVRCFGGIAPYEYSDATQGEIQGPYTIIDCLYWDPDLK